MKNSNRIIWWAVTIAGLAAAWVATDLHVWYISLIVGIGDALVLFGIWRALTAAWISSVGAWGLSLLWQARSFPISRAASTIAGMMGLGANGWIPILLTLLVAFLLASAGAWLGFACLRAVGIPKRNVL